MKNNLSFVMLGLTRHDKRYWKTMDSRQKHAGMTLLLSMRDIMIKNNKASLHPKCYILFGKKKINMKGDSPWRKITDLILQVNTFT